MAERIHLSIPAGSRSAYRLEWAAAGSAARQGWGGSLEWNAVVHGADVTVDLEVFVELSSRSPRPGDASRFPAAELSATGRVADAEFGGAPTEQTSTAPLTTQTVTGTSSANLDEDSPGILLLQEVTRCRAFRGTFVPQEDHRLNEGIAERVEDGTAPRGKPRQQIEAVIFDFRNEFSWWTPKEVDIILLRHIPQELPSADVPELPPMQPNAPIQRGTCGGGFAGAELVVPSQHRQGSAATRGSDLHGVRFASRLHAWLSAAECLCPPAVDTSKDEGHGAKTAAREEWLNEFRERATKVRDLCQKLLHERPPLVQEQCDGA